MRLQVIKATFWGMTTLVAVGAAGLIGYYQGFARALGMYDLERGAPAIFADGVQMIRDCPGHIFNAGLASAGEWLVAMGSMVIGVGLLAIAVLAFARGSAADRTERPDQPPNLRRESSRPPDLRSLEARALASPVALTMVAAGGVLVVLAALAHIGWTVFRHHRLGSISLLDPSVSITDWINIARVAAGTDLIILIACVIWLLFALRLPGYFPWLRVLSTVLIGASVVLAFGAASISVGTMTHIMIPRPLVEPAPDISQATDDLDRAPALIVGRTGSHLVLLGVEGRTYLVPANQSLEVRDRKSIPEYVESAREAAAAREPVHNTVSRHRENQPGEDASSADDGG